MKKIVRLFLVLATLLVGCTASAETGAPTDPNVPIEVNAGESFTIVIESNPTTGYHWETVGDLNGVEFVSRDYKADEPVLTGSGGVDIWTFKAVSAGETTLVFGNYPPGDATTSEQELQFTVTVQ